MDRKEFEAILKNCGVPEKFFDLWWGQWGKYTFNFPLTDHHQSLSFFATQAVQKGYVSTPM